MPKRDKVREEWRKLHNGELHDLYSSPSILQVIKSRRMWWAGHLTCGGEVRRIRGFVGKTRGKRPLGKSRRRWEDNIKMYLQAVGCGGMDWIKLAEDRERWRAVVNGVMNLGVPYNVGNFLTS